MSGLEDVLTPFDKGLRLTVKAKPGVRKPRAPRLVDLGEGKRAVEIAVAAPPEDGRANKAILAALAEALELKKGDLDIKTGASGRLKVVEIYGEPAQLCTRVAAWLGRCEGTREPELPF